MMSFTFRHLLLFATILSCTLSIAVQASDYSMVINHGRVTDPETGLDATRHIGIQGNRIIAISDTPLEGARTINASGLVVAPGFIDLHTHSPTGLGQYYQLFDGVTTALELEAGTYPVGEYAVQIQDHALINFGASAGYMTIRLLEMDGIAMGDITQTPGPVGLKGWMTALRFLLTDFQTALKRTFTEHASAEELAALRARLNEGLDQGGLGIGLALDYISEAVDSRELEMIFEVSGQRQAPIFVHIRRGINGDPTGAVIHHYLDEAWTLRAIQEPGVIIVSNLITMKSKDEHVPPHNGAFTRILGRYVREQQALDLPTALSKMTLLPAQRLQAYAPAFSRKGRIQVDMDADLTLFDPDTVLDRATYRNPYQEAQGIVHVVVGGEAVVTDGRLVPDTYPGKRILSTQRK
jgi:N-acyl-D-aspartate/D-glutamate deacylase